MEKRKTNFANARDLWNWKHKITLSKKEDYSKLKKKKRRSFKSLYSIWGDNEKDSK